MTLPVDTKAILLTALGHISDREPNLRIAWGESQEFDAIFLVRRFSTEPVVFDLSVGGVDYDVTIIPKQPSIEIPDHPRGGI